MELNFNWMFQSTEYVTSVHFLCKELYVVLCCCGGTIQVVETATGHLVAQQQNAHPEILSMSVLFECTFATSGDDGQIHIWQVNADEKRLECKASISFVKDRIKWIEHVLFVESELLLLATCGKHLKVWKVDKECVVSPIAKEFPDATSTITDLVYSKSKQCIAYCSYGKVVVLEVPSLHIQKEFEWKGSFIQLYWSENGQYLLAAMQESSLVIWNLVSEETPRYLSGFPGKVTSLSWMKNSKCFVMITGRDSSCAMIQVASIKPSSHIKVKLLGSDEDQHSIVKFCPIYPELVATGARDGCLRIYDVTLPAEDALVGEVEPPSAKDNDDETEDSTTAVEWFSKGIVSCLSSQRVECYSVLKKA